MIKIRHNGGETVSAGSYWNFSTGDRVTIDREGTLPGNGKTVYYKASPLLVIAAGPVLGLVYAAFLPFIGLAIVMKLMATKLLGGTAEGVSKVATFNWRPSEAYLAGKRHREEQNGDAANGERPDTGQE